MTAMFAQLHFLRPHALWLLLLLPPLMLWWHHRRRRAQAWRGIVDPHLLPHLLAGAGRAGVAPLLALSAGFVLAVLALAGPSWRQGEQPLWQTQAPLVVALDLSSATLAADLPPSRLLQARRKLATLLEARQGGQVALVAYAGDAFTVAPLTEDARNVALFLDALAPDVMPADGQHADRAIAWSVRLLRQAGFTRGEVLLLTDHADAQALAAATAARAQGYRVSALGMGSAVGAAYRAGDGTLRRAQLDAASLRALASRGGGTYADWRRDDADLAELDVLQPQVSQADRDGQGRVMAWRDEGFWLLPPLLLLALLAFRRGAAVWLLAGCAMLWTLPSQAAERDWWRRADQREHNAIEKGVQAYREGDFTRAEQAFAGHDSADALYNRGNALAKQGRYDEAIAAYDAALRRQPGMADAIANRAAVERARKRADGQGQGSSGKGDDGRSSSAQPSGSQPPQQQRQQQRDQQPPSQASQQQAPPPEPPPRANEAGTPPPPAEPADAQAQQAADQAQRQRMQQALARQKPDEAKPAQDAQSRDETPEQRERRQALEAWLRRVPDDPGGLLKAKFQLEHERRMREGQ